MGMDANNHAWELVFKRDGRVFTELLPAFSEAVAEFERRGARTVLDLGCGNGRHTVALAQRGFDVTGLDISRSGLRETRLWLAEEGITAQLLCADTRRSLPLQSGSFDAVLSTQVIHHAVIAEVRVAIAEIRRVLRPGGVAFVTVAGLTGDRPLENEIEPGTVVPREASEKGLPHHLFSLEEARREFSAFHVLSVDARAEGKVMAIWAEKPKEE
jgi:SAM-dependent methyltransferase